MVAHLLRLRLLLLGKGLTSSLGATLGRVLLGVLAVVLDALILAMCVQVRQFDAEFVRRFAVVLGALLMVAAFALPVLFTRRELIDPRALRGYGLRTRSVAPVLLLLGLIGPFLLAVPLAAIPVAIWPDAPGWLIAVTVALLLAEALLLVRLGVVVGTALTSRPRRRAVAAVVLALAVLALVVILLVLALSRIVPFLPANLQPLAFVLIADFAPLRLGSLADALAWTPVSALWAAPSGLWAAELLGIGIVWVALLALLWALAVRYGLRATRRSRIVRERRVPGFFRFSRATPQGTIAARAWTYWVRDSRYWAVLVFLPAIPIASALVLWVAQVPPQAIALVPLPIMTVILAWATLHNDISYDSTAVWAHLSAQSSGVADRLGRAEPVLAFGALLLAIGVPLTTLAFGDWNVLPVVSGVNLALLLGGVGVASALSTRRPYPAPRPGDGAFRSPVSGAVRGETGFGQQAASLLLILLVAAPAAATGGLWIATRAEFWGWASLATGVGFGAIVLAVGVAVGARAFDAAAPELLAYTMRS